jgi:hypothetical protein
LEAVFREWVDQHIGLDWCIAGNGKYVKWIKQWSLELFLRALRSGDAHPSVGHVLWSLMIRRASGRHMSLAASHILLFTRASQTLVQTNPLSLFCANRSGAEDLSWSALDA